MARRSATPKSVRTNPLILEIGRAAQEFRNGRIADATARYDDIAARAADDAAVHVELGHLCNEFGVPDQAATHYAIAVEQQPDNPHFLSCLAVAYLQSFRYEDAFPLLQKAESIDPDIFEVIHGLGVYYQNLSDYVEARRYLERAVKLKPGNPAALTNLANVLSHVDEHEQGLVYARKAIKIAPENTEAHYAVGNILTQLGRVDEAIRHFEGTIRQHRKFGAAYHMYAEMKKFSESDKAFIEKSERILAQGMPARDRYCLHFALGKMYNDCREWEKAFQHFNQANLLQKKPFEFARLEKTFGQTKKIYSATALGKYRQSGHVSRVPVFIVGMPRSGTTLMERMIASHPQGAGAGELEEIAHIVDLLAPPDMRARYAAMTRKNLTANNIAAYAERYLRVLRQGRESAERIVDKMPSNYYHLGLISTLFPNATIIHAIRHPLDSCLSCYFQNFTKLQWANDLSLIADIYRLYREAMAYWKRVLPEGKIVDVVYEELIEDPEAQGRRLLEACGLSWDASLLDFHRKEGIVKTASLWQVRQPIYQSSRKRWKNYAPYAGDLAYRLAEFLQADREELAELGIEIPKTARGGWARRLLG